MFVGAAGGGTGSNRRRPRSGDAAGTNGSPRWLAEGGAGRKPPGGKKQDEKMVSGVVKEESGCFFSKVSDYL